MQYLTYNFDNMYGKDQEMLYKEPEKIMYIYFILKGTVVFTLPRYNNAVFFKAHPGSIIGLEDYVYNLMAEGETFSEDKKIPLDLFEADDYGRRRFNTKSDGPTSMKRLTIFNF